MRTTNAGGAANIRGIHYQMLYSLLETSTLRISECGVSEDGSYVSKAFLVLEPINGGDTLVCHPDVTRVQQLKTKSDGGTWSLGDMVTEVFPDLYKAVDLDKVQTFEFITEGRMGEWKEVKSFFESLRRRPFPSDTKAVLNSLDTTDEISFVGSLDESQSRGNQKLNEKAIFMLIAKSVHQKVYSGKRKDRKSIEDTYRHLWKMLSHFEFVESRKYTDIEEVIRQRLHAIIDNTDNLQNTIDSLVSSLVRQASCGNAKIVAKDFFRDQGIVALPLTSWHRLITESERRLYAHLPLYQYFSDEDARKPIPESELRKWHSGDKPFLVMTGESGQGKTWRLCALAMTIAKHSPVVLVTAQGDAKSVMKEVAKEFWQSICLHESDLDFERVSQRVREAIPLKSSNWLYVFVDNVLTSIEAIDLIKCFALVEGVRLVLTTSSQISDVINSSFNKLVLTTKIGNFSDDELIRYIADGNHTEWYRIPSDISSIISFPLLASLYKKIAPDGKWSDPNEYMLYDRYYQERIMRPTKEVSRLFTVPFRNAALAVWNSSKYPWSASQLDQFGFKDSLVQHLAKIGWLAEDNSGHYRVWHDRLLNWFVADALSREIEEELLDPKEIGSMCAELLWPGTSSRANVTLRYVPMDLIWLLSVQQDGGHPNLDIIVESLERDFRISEILYRKMLPTIGSTLASAMFRHLVSGASEKNQVRRHIANLLARIRKESVATEAIPLLSNQDPEIWRSAVSILEGNPTSVALEPLWNLYCKLRYEKYKGGLFLSDDSHSNVWDQTNVWNAIESCVQLDSDWLVSKILDLAPNEYYMLSPLIAYLRALPDGSKRWFELKEYLRDKLHADGQRQFANNVYHWRDQTEIEWLRGRISIEEERVGLHCFRALIRIAPDVAVTELGTIAVNELAPSRRWTLADLISIRPIETKNLLKSLILLHTDHMTEYIEALYDIPGGLDDDTFNVLLDALPEQYDEGRINPLWSKLRAIASIKSLSLLKCLMHRAGSSWEDELTKLLLKQSSEQATTTHSVLESAMIILYYCNGHGFTQVVNQWLQSDKYYVCMEGILLSKKRANNETLEKLEVFAMDDSNEPARSNFRHAAQGALAALGAFEPLVRCIVRWHKDLNRDVLDTQLPDKPLDKGTLAPAFEALLTDRTAPGAIMALGFGKQADYVDMIATVLSQEGAENNNDITNACVWALNCMPNLTDLAVEVLTRRLTNPNGRWLVIHTLLRNSNENAVKGLLRYLKEKFSEDLTKPYYSSDAIHEPIQVAHFLLHHASSRSDTLELCKKRIVRGDKLDALAEKLVLIAVGNVDSSIRDVLLKEERAKELLKTKAIFTDSPWRGSDEEYILGLEKLDHDAGYAAAERLLHDDEITDFISIPYLMLKIDREQGIRDLLSYMIREERNTRRMACVRAIHQANGNKEIIEIANVSGYEEVACFALGFCSPSEQVTNIVKAFLYHENVSVYEQACIAMRRLDSTARAIEISNAFMLERDVSRKWILLDIALAIGDLGDINERIPDWLQKMFDKMVPLMADYASDKIIKLRQEAYREVESDDRRNS